MQSTFLNLSRKDSSEDGFSLIEVLVIIGVLSVLTGVGFASLALESMHRK